MAKYEKLKRYLQQSNLQTVRLSFNHIENTILGFKLPSSARKHNAWWSNGGHSHSKSWIDAGYKARPIFKQGEVEFYAGPVIVPTPSQTIPPPAGQPIPKMKASPLLMAQQVSNASGLKNELQDIVFLIQDIMFKLQDIIEKL